MKFSDFLKSKFFVLALIIYITLIYHVHCPFDVLLTIFNMSKYAYNLYKGPYKCYVTQYGMGGCQISWKKSVTKMCY